MRPDSEQRRQELLWDVEVLTRLDLQIAWCQYGMDARAKAARDATWQAKQRWMEGQADPWRACRRRATGRRRGLRCVSWWVA